MEQANRMESGKAGHLDMLTVLSGTTSYIYMVDRGHRLRFASPNALKIMGLTFEEIEGRRFQDLSLPPGSVEGFKEVIQRAFDTELPQKGESSYLLPNGRKFYSYDVVPVRNAEGEIDAAVLTARDITPTRTADLLGEVLNRTYAAINSSMSVPEIMERVIAISSSVMDCDAAAMFTRTGDRWTLRHVSGTLLQTVIGSIMTDDVLRKTFLGPQEQPTIVPDVQETGWIDQTAIGRFAIRSFIGIPLKVRSKVVGALVFAFLHPRGFSTEEVDFSLKLSTAVSLTMENAELYRHERERRFLLQTILDDIPAVIIDVNGVDLTIRWTNRFAHRYQPERFGDANMIGLPLEVVIPQVANGGISRMFKEVARSGRPFYDNEFLLSGLGPEATYWRGAIVPLRLGDSEVPDLLIMAVEVTDQVKARKQAEELSAQAMGERERIMTILETLPIGAALVDRTGRVVDMNAAAMNLWASIRPSFTDLQQLDEVQAWSENGKPMRMDDWGMTKAAFRGIASNNEMVTLKRYDGREMVMMMSSAPLLDPSQGVVGAVVIGQDLTNQLQVQKRMVICQEREELYVDLLTHDINNLNASAMGYLQLLQDTSELKEKERGWVDRSLEALEENTRLIENIRGLRALESGVESLEMIDLDRVLYQVVDGIIPHPSREIEIRVSSRGQHCILASPLVEEVFSNLMDNAIKHSDGPLTIWISVSTLCETGREYHRIDVVDDGPGIPDRVKDIVFSRAWRGRSKGVGKGLGLFLVRRLVEDLEGRVWVEDRVVGDPQKGAKFVVLLPAVGCDEVIPELEHRS